MKKTTWVVLIMATLCSCSKSIEPLTNDSEMMANVKPSAEYNNSLFYGVIDRAARNGIFSHIWLDYRIGRISMWMLYKQDNYTTSRADYIEFLISDDFVSDVDENDKIKAVDSTDNLAIKNAFTPYLLWKEQRYYPKDEDIIKLKSWNYTADSYFFKFQGSNFPPFIKVFLHDKYFDSLTPIDVYSNLTGWYQFEVGGNDVNNGILQNDTHRFEIVIRPEY